MIPGPLEHLTVGLVYTDDAIVQTGGIFGHSLAEYTICYPATQCQDAMTIDASHLLPEVCRHNVRCHSLRYHINVLCAIYTTEFQDDLSRNEVPCLWPQVWCLIHSDNKALTPEYCQCVKCARLSTSKHPGCQGLTVLPFGVMSGMIL